MGKKRGRLGDLARGGKKVTIELPDTAFSALQADPQEFSRQMRIAAAVKWYELGRISQKKGAEIAGQYPPLF